MRRHALRYRKGQLVIKSDFIRYFETSTSDTKLKKTTSALLAPGFRAMVVYRFGKWVERKNRIFKIFLLPVYFFLNQRVKIKWGIQIPLGCEIGEGFYIGHFGGITIAADAKIGKNVNISQLVTIGEAGRGKRAGAPQIGDDVYIGAGAKVIGKIKVGDNVKIGANAVVYKDIPPDAVVVNYPGFKIISYEGNRKKEV